MELAELMIVKPMAASKGGSVGGGPGGTGNVGVSINVKFVQAGGAQAESALIDVTPRPPA